MNYDAATGRRSMDYDIANNIQNQYKSIMRRSGYQVVNVFNTIGGVSNETGCRRTDRTVVVRTVVRHCWWLRQWRQERQGQLRRPVAGEMERPVAENMERLQCLVAGETAAVCCTHGL